MDCDDQARVVKGNHHSNANTVDFTDKAGLSVLVGVCI
jgi:hypothetical protein